jgi:hypothetical protein
MGWMVGVRCICGFFFYRGDGPWERGGIYGGEKEEDVGRKNDRRRGVREMKMLADWLVGMKYEIQN